MKYKLSIYGGAGETIPTGTITFFKNGGQAHLSMVTGDKKELLRSLDDLSEFLRKNIESSEAASKGVCK